MRARYSSVMRRAVYVPERMASCRESTVASCSSKGSVPTMRAAGVAGAGVVAGALGAQPVCVAITPAPAAAVDSRKRRRFM